MSDDMPDRIFAWVAKITFGKSGLEPMDHRQWWTSPPLDAPEAGTSYTRTDLHTAALAARDARIAALEAGLRPFAQYSRVVEHFSRNSHILSYSWRGDPKNSHVTAGDFFDALALLDGGKASK